ncbi:Kae1-associated kinase Bud32, partial [Candidatus Pacearchaeota archaeon CG_4_10_14_0_2_um_filter_05_32_18]
MKPEKLKIIQQGAEAVIIKRGNEIIKDRIVKKYRLPELDNKIRVKRTRKEAKLLATASKIINVPKLKKIEESKITLGYIRGKKLSEHLDNLNKK